MLLFIKFLFSYKPPPDFRTHLNSIRSIATYRKIKKWGIESGKLLIKDSQLTPSRLSTLTSQTITQEKKIPMVLAINARLGSILNR